MLHNIYSASATTQPPEIMGIGWVCTDRFDNVQLQGAHAISGQACDPDAGEIMAATHALNSIQRKSTVTVFVGNATLAEQINNNDPALTQRHPEMRQVYGQFREAIDEFNSFRVKSVETDVQRQYSWQARMLARGAIPLPSDPGRGRRTSRFQPRRHL